VFAVGLFLSGFIEVKILPGLYSEGKLCKSPSFDCFPVPKTNMMPIKIQNASPTCTLYGFDNQVEIHFVRKISSITKDDFADIMDMDLLFGICCPTQRITMNFGVKSDQ
jgi:hypothetical protein